MVDWLVPARGCCCRGARALLRALRAPARILRFDTGRFGVSTILLLLLLLYAGYMWLSLGRGHAGGDVALAAQTTGEVLTLARSVEIALENNPEVIQARDALGLAGSKEREAEGAFEPNMSLEAGFNASTSELGSGVTNSGGQLTISLRDVLPTGKYIGRSSFEVQNARLGVSDAERMLADAREGVKYTVLSAYVEVLKAERSLDLAERSLEQARVALTDTEAKKQAGNAIEADVLDARRSVRKAEAGVSGAESRLKTAYSRFNQALGRDLDMSVRLAGDLQYEPVQENLDELVAHALEHRVEVQRARDDLTRGRLTLEKTIEAGKPVVTIEGGYADDTWSAGLDFASPDWNLAWQITGIHEEGTTGQTALGGAGGSMGSPIGDRKLKGWYAGVGLSWSPFDGGVSREKRLQAEINLRQLERAVSIQETSVTLAVREAYYAFQAAEEAVAGADLGVSQAQEALRVTRLRYEAGLATGRDLAASELALLQAQADHAFAVYDYILAKAALERSAGKPIEIQGYSDSGQGTSR
ncbi:MAG: TolC family protein [Firmicutes bacterium]|nr:TolC family protein [Bacillota bacterium]